VYYPLICLCIIHWYACVLSIDMLVYYPLILCMLIHWETQSLREKVYTTELPHVYLYKVLSLKYYKFYLKSVEQ